MSRRFVTRPTEPEHVVDAVQYLGSNADTVDAFVRQVGGRLVEWIDPARWVYFEDGREGFPVPLGAWVTRTVGDERVDMYEAEEFEQHYMPITGGTRDA